MKKKKIVKKLLAWLCLCLLFMGMAVYADETEESGTAASTKESVTEAAPEKKETEAEKTDLQSAEACSIEQEVKVKNWNRRIYEIQYVVDGNDVKAAEIRTYVGKNFHITDGAGNILSEGTFIDSNGDSSGNPKDGKVCRDFNGWYILWEKPDLSGWGSHKVYIQADADFVGGNNQVIGIEGMSGIYMASDSGTADVVLDTCLVNVAAEVDAIDVDFPVMKGIDLSQSEFLDKAAVKMECVYGNLRNLPIKVQWYRVTGGVEEPVGNMVSSAPYHLPESEVTNLTEAREYKVKIYYNGEASTEEARMNSDGHEVPVSDKEPMDEAYFRTEMVGGHITAAVQLEQLPYNSDVSHIFRFKLYRFDSPNQMINDDTPFTSYEVVFEKNGDQPVKYLHIENLTAGWYTLVPENPEEEFMENVDKRRDNCIPNSRTGSSAGVDFHIGEIVENQYSWEIIRYQGQDPENPLGDNFFSITYNYMENLYGVSYAMNLPEGSVLYGNPPIDIARYLPGTMVSIQGGNGMTADGWQFAGWALEAGNGVYTAGEKLYSDVSIHGISVETQAPMKSGGLTLYGRWIPVYSVYYDGNTNTGGTLPQDTKGTVREGSNIYYSGDEIRVKEPGNLEKVDADGTRYVFDGWSVNQDGSGTRLRAGDKIKVAEANVTFYAQWRVVGTDKYAVTYIASIPKDALLTGVLPQDEEKYEEGAIVKVKDHGDMAVEHYRFAGWSLTSREDALYQSGEEIFGTKSAGETVTGAETAMKAQGLTFYSRWIPLYQVTYRANANTVENLPADENEYEAGDMVTILSGDKMKREGYQFIGWNTKMDGSGESYDSGLKFNMPEGNIELYAQWKKLPEPETAPEESESMEKPEKGGVMPLVILAMVGVVCIGAYLVYQWMTHRKR
ncbi:InlB B-repeat-containing protein [Frisingicoccus sp.]|uniref:InlB B-repeat-containing protein n=1 Tax=Frisingicoccus sp. TaxID=1918627 RepID=UPI003AB13050